MTMNDFKGTIYDLLGYFAPGLVATGGLAVTFQRIHNPQNVIGSFRDSIEGISSFEIFLMIIVSYIFGHAIASLSSMIIEKVMMEKIRSLKKVLSSDNILDNEHYNLLCSKYLEEFGTKYSDNNLRKVICFVQARQNSIYDTVLVFLSFYGMARNFSLIFGVLAIIEIWLCFFNPVGNIFCLVIYALMFIIFLYEYIRFRKYFVDTILSAFLLS